MASLPIPGAARAPNMRLAGQQFGAMRGWLQRRLEAERDQLPLWLPVALGAGVAAWFLLPDPRAWSGALALFVALAGVAVAAGEGGRASRTLLIGALAAALGLGLIWLKAERATAPVLGRAGIVQIIGRIERIEPLAARHLVRVTLAPIARTDLPPRVRVNLADTDVPPGLTRGATISVGARLMPPASAAVPGAYDFARVAWFQGLGASGRASRRSRSSHPENPSPVCGQGCRSTSARDCRAARAGSQRRWRRAIRAG